MTAPLSQRSGAGDLDRRVYGVDDDLMCQAGGAALGERSSPVPGSSIWRWYSLQFDDLNVKPFGPNATNDFGNFHACFR